MSLNIQEGKQDTRFISCVSRVAGDGTQGVVLTIKVFTMSSPGCEMPYKAQAPLCFPRQGPQRNPSPGLHAEQATDTHTQGRPAGAQTGPRA
jgi:hypothetical protein